MKEILVILFIVVSGIIYAQEWAPYEVDENLTVTIPADFIVNDTLDQRIIYAYLDNAVVLVQRMENKGKTAQKIHNKKNLLDAYSAFEKDFIGTQYGVLVERRPMEIGTFQLIHFSYVAEANGQMELRHCRTIFLNEFWYIIQFWEIQSKSREFTPEREKLFSSIKLPSGQGLTHQFSDPVMPATPGEKFGYAIATLFVLGVIGAVITLVVVLIYVRKKRKTYQPGDF